MLAEPRIHRISPFPVVVFMVIVVVVLIMLLENTNVDLGLGSMYGACDRVVELGRGGGV